MICPIFDAQAKKINLLSYGIDNAEAYLEERRTALNYLQESVSCPNNNGLMCGITRTTGTCFPSVTLSTPNNLRVTGLTNPVLSRIDDTHLQATFTLEILFDNPSAVILISGTLPTSILYDAVNSGVVTTQTVIGFSRVGVTNNWNVAILITSTPVLTTQQYTLIGILRVTDTLTNIDQSINISNTV